MGKVKIEIYCYLSAKVLQKCLVIGPPPRVAFSSKHFNFIGCHDNPKVKFAKTYFKKPTHIYISGIKLKLCRIVYNIILIKNVFFYRCLSTLVAMATFG